MATGALCATGAGLDADGGGDEPRTGPGELGVDDAAGLELPCGELPAELTGARGLPGTRVELGTEVG